jgi:ammonia channel protein AmtB
MFSSCALFIALWSLLVYSPVAHWVWDELTGLDQSQHAESAYQV